jgi:hypothetical protein
MRLRGHSCGKRGVPGVPGVDRAPQPFRKFFFNFMRSNPAPRDTLQTSWLKETAVDIVAWFGDLGPL